MQLLADFGWFISWVSINIDIPHYGTISQYRRYVVCTTILLDISQSNKALSAPMDTAKLPIE
jgi:hypothetical protein